MACDVLSATFPRNARWHENPRLTSQCHNRGENVIRGRHFFRDGLKRINCGIAVDRPAGSHTMHTPQVAGALVDNNRSVIGTTPITTTTTATTTATPQLDNCNQVHVMTTSQKKKQEKQKKRATKKQEKQKKRATKKQEKQKKRATNKKTALLNTQEWNLQVESCSSSAPSQGLARPLPTW